MRPWVAAAFNAAESMLDYEAEAEAEVAAEVGLAQSPTSAQDYDLFDELEAGPSGAHSSTSLTSTCSILVTETTQRILRKVFTLSR